MEQKPALPEGITLIDGNVRNAQHPSSFFIPDDDEKHSLKVGSFVKLGFETVDRGGERMWVEITDILEDGSMIGTLVNTPIFTNLSWGDKVHFELRHVLAL